MQTVISKLESIENKINCLQTAPASKSIVINSCQPAYPTLKQRSTTMTQTDLTSNDPEDEPTAVDDTEDASGDTANIDDASQATSTPSL